MESGSTDGQATPRLNLVVIRTSDLDRAEVFYRMLGLTLERHAHGKGPIHLASECEQIVFEIYPLDAGQPCAAARIGFAVADVDNTVSSLTELGAKVRNLPKDGPWGRRAVVEDFDGNILELTNSIN
jgi:predicted enzyme related to lactoylglutathione lyase